jgi:hypothetical protein
MRLAVMGGFMNSDGQFWLGLAFAIPLSIVANLFTPRIQDWFSKRSAASAARREATLSREQARIDEYSRNPTRFNSFLLTTLVVATMLGAGIGAFTALLYMMGTIANGRVGAMLAQALSIFGGLLITGICLQAAKISIKVREARNSEAEN